MFDCTIFVAVSFLGSVSKFDFFNYFFNFMFLGLPVSICYLEFLCCLIFAFLGWVLGFFFFLLNLFLDEQN